MQAATTARTPCLRAAVSLALSAFSFDNEDRVENYASKFQHAWQQVFKCQSESGKVFTLCHKSDKIEPLIECDTFEFRDLFTLAAFAGKSFSLFFPCGKKEQFGPLIKGVFH